MENFSGKTGIDSRQMKRNGVSFFKYHHEQQAKPLIEKLCKKDEGIMHARKQVEKLPRSYLRFMTVEMDRFRAHIDRIYEEKAVYDEGLADGLAKGIAEGSAKADKKWQDVIADKDAKIAYKDAEIEKLRAELSKK